jgi:hypothetical protein
MCIRGQPEDDCDDTSEKAALHVIPAAQLMTQEVAIDILNALYNAEKPGKLLERHIETIVGERGWTESLAGALLSQLENALRSGASMGQAMKEASDKSVAAAFEFAREHPVWFTLIALGILVILAPWVLEILGFGARGPIKGISGLHQSI